MLTRQGWGAVLLAVTITVIGRMFGVLELYVLGAGIIARPVAAYHNRKSRAMRFAVA